MGFSQSHKSYHLGSLLGSVFLELAQVHKYKRVLVWKERTTQLFKGVPP